MSSDCRMRYDGLLEENSASEETALSENIRGAVFAMWRYAAPVSAGRVLCAESQQMSAPRSIG